MSELLFHWLLEHPIILPIYQFRNTEASFITTSWPNLSCSLKIKTHVFLVIPCGDPFSCSLPLAFDAKPTVLWSCSSCSTAEDEAGFLSKSHFQPYPFNCPQKGARSSEVSCASSRSMMGCFFSGKFGKIEKRNLKCMVFQNIPSFTLEHFPNFLWLVIPRDLAHKLRISFVLLTSLRSSAF